MAGSFKTGAPELLTASQQMVDTNELLQDAGRQLGQAVDSVGGSWSGDAALAFTNLMTSYSTDFSKLNTALFNIAEQVSGAAKDYAAQEEAAASDVSAIAATLSDG
jgi:WXG100 family type VII secretion target